MRIVAEAQGQMPDTSPTTLQEHLSAVLPHAAELPRLAADGCVAVVVSLADWTPWLVEAAMLIDDAEHARAFRHQAQVERDARVLAYALHRMLLGRVMGCAPGEVAIVRDGKGCPRVRESRVSTSLSHAGDRVAFAISVRGDVGIDIEPMSHAADMPELASHVAHPDEWAALLRMPMPARAMALLELWVRKEAVLKAAGIGLECGMETFVANDGTALPLPAGPRMGQETRVCMLDAGPDWSLAVALPPHLPCRLMVA